ncbi:hypothetical protein HOC01_00855 [archaeon]|jgi:hypothetical protein|nr:hypothetical protein [archaeon]MBT6698609.1 hypothetical protein [archaeon]
MIFTIDTVSDSIEDIQKIIDILEKHVEDHKRTIFFNDFDEEVSEIKSSLVIEDKFEFKNIEDKNEGQEVEAQIGDEKFIENEIIPVTVKNAHLRDPRRSVGTAPSFPKFLSLIKKSEKDELESDLND